MKCPKCNSDIAINARFCHECGTRIEYEGRCCSNPECNRTGLPSEAQYCPDCGMRIKNSENINNDKLNTSNTPDWLVNQLSKKLKEKNYGNKD